MHFTKYNDNKKVIKMRNVNRQAIGEFIDVDQAYQRIQTFAATSQFNLLSDDDQMNAMAFILVTKRVTSEPVMENCIAEDDIVKELKQRK